MTKVRRIGILVAATSFTLATQIVSSSPAFALSSDEAALITYDRQCEQLAVDDCATYDPSLYDANWKTFEDPVTGEDYVAPDTGVNPWTYRQLTTAAQGTAAASNWTCAGVAAKPTFQGEAQQTCAGTGWQAQRVIVVMQWKHTRRFARDSWVTIAQQVGPLTNSNPDSQGALATCPGSRKRTFRTVGVGYAQNDRYGGPNGGGRDDSKEVKLPCDRTSP